MTKKPVSNVVVSIRQQLLNALTSQRPTELPLRCRNRQCANPYALRLDHDDRSALQG
jgi:hypothetical protein